MSDAAHLSSNGPEGAGKLECACSTGARSAFVWQKRGSLEPHGHSKRIVVAAKSLRSAMDGPGVQVGDRVETLGVKLGTERLVSEA